MIDIEKYVHAPITILNGIERETLRVDNTGHVSKKDHPLELGSKLTHPYITTDYSEALLEFISKPHESLDELFDELTEIHQFAYRKNPKELLWPSSMPGILPTKDEDIKVAHYGKSNVGRLKEIYREGLGHRYGKKMQSISGLHFNFSVCDEFWSIYRDQKKLSSLQEAKDVGYFSLIRNYKRYQWMIPFLYGASNHVDASFLAGRDHNLESTTNDTFANLKASSLRMGGLGYTSEAQKQIRVCYNELSTYIETLEKSRLASVKTYELIGIKDKSGKYKQLNTNLLQIDNEFYSTIRPKRAAKSKESALKALSRGGVDYVEVRILDINPFAPLGITKEQAHFLNLFLMTLLLKESPDMDMIDYNRCEEDLSKVIANGEMLTEELKVAALSLVEDMKKVTSLYKYKEPFNFKKIEKIIKGEEPNLVNILNRELSNKSFVEVTLSYARLHAKFFSDSTQLNKLGLEEISTKSITDQESLEAKDSLDFDVFHKKYFQDIII